MTLPAFMVAPAMNGALVLAQQPGSGDQGGQGEDFGKSSPMGLLLLLLFAIAIVFLIRSMTKHLKRLPTSFDAKDEQSEAKQAEEQRTGEQQPEELRTEAKQPEEAGPQGRE